MTTLFGTAGEQDVERVFGVLAAAGPRGASHEDFVEAGLARSYIGGLNTLVDKRGLEVRVDFTTGAARWSLSADPTATRQAA
jgi:hypothetical protein